MMCIDSDPVNHTDTFRVAIDLKMNCILHFKGYLQQIILMSFSGLKFDLIRPAGLYAQTI